MSLSLITAGSILICPDLRLRQSPSSLTISSSRSLSLSSSSHREISSRLIKVTAMERTAETISGGVPNNTMKLLFVEMGVGYDQHGQDVTSAAMKACKNAISSNSIPAFRRGSIPGVSFGEMKLQIKLGVSSPLNEIASRRDSQTDSVINSDYQEELVESHAVRFVSPPESPDTVDSEEDPTVPLQSANLLSSSPAKKRLKVPLRDVVKAIVMNSRSTEEDEDRGIEKKKKRSCVQILIEKGFNFP